MWVAPEAPYYLALSGVLRSSKFTVFYPTGTRTGAILLAAYYLSANRRILIQKINKFDSCRRPDKIIALAVIMLINPVLVGSWLILMAVVFTH